VEFCRRQAAQRHMERGVRRIDERARVNGMSRRDSGAGSKGAAWIDVRWQRQGARASRRSDESKQKETQRNVRLKVQ